MSSSTDQLLSVIDAGFDVFDLGRPLVAGMAQSPNHPRFQMALQRRHGDTSRADGSSAANEIIVTGGHVGTHIDALCHVSYRGELYGHISAAEAQSTGRFSVLGIETIPPMICRGILLDVPATLGVAACAPGYEITPDDLEATVERQGVAPVDGGVILVRSGWGSHFSDGDRYLGHSTGVPGPGEPGARWLSAYLPRAVGADTIAFERLAPAAGHALLPAHRHLLVEAGIHIVETLNLEELAAKQVYTFGFVLVPLPIVGATGSPVRPLALVGRTGEQ